MTATQAKLLWAGVLLAVAWLFQEKRATPNPTGDVELGVPTVDGVFDGVYYSPHGTVAAPDDSNPATDSVMRGLIDESNAAIAAAGGPPT